MLRSSAIVFALVLISAGSARAGEWKPAGTIPSRNDAVAFAPSGGQAIVFGDSPNAQKYDESTNDWTNAASPFIYVSKQALPIGSDQFVIAAGNVGQVWAADAWKPTLDAVSAGNARGSQQLVTLADGRVLACGGDDSTATPEGAVFCRIFDPKTSAWSDAGSMNIARVAHSLVLMPDGKVLVVGGWNNAGNPEASAEIYDPVANTWTKTTDSPIPRVHAAMIALGTGKIAVIGGGRESPAPAIDLFDPATKTWSTGATLVKSRSYPMIAKVGTSWMIAGGLDGAGDAIADVEFLNEATGKTTAAPPMLAKRALGFAVTLAPSGNVLVGGGSTRNDGGAVIVTTAERYVVSPTSDAGTDASPDAASDASAEAAVDAAAPHDPNKPSVQGSSQRCTSPSDCASGFCVEGVCCNEACDRRCYSCALPSSPGICTVEPAGVDLKGSCGIAKSCVSTCDGAGTCIGAGPGTMCARSRCNGPSTGSSAAYCSAAGSACDESALVPFDCGPFACDPAFGACLSQCKTSSDCASGFVCDVPTHACIAAAPEESGGCAVSSVGAKRSALMLTIALVLLGRRRVRRIERH